MNILVDIRTLMDERYSGVSEYTRLLLTALLRADSENRYFFYYNSYADISARLPRFDFPNVRLIRTQIPNKLFNYPLLRLWRRPRFDNIVQRLTGEKMDIFFMPHVNFAAWSPSVKTILAVHDLSFFRFPEFFSWRKNLWHFLLGIKQLIRRFDTVVAFSHNTAEDVQALSGIAATRVSVIASGLEAGFSPMSSSDPRLSVVRQKYGLPKRFILALSTIEPRKNIEGLIEAFEILKRRDGFKDLQLIIAGGRGWKATPIYRRATTSFVSSDIRFIGYVENEERVALYNLASTFVFPSFYEGFGFPPLEAMACGTPTIVAAASCLPEMVGSGAITVDPYDSTLFGEALYNVLSDEFLARRLSAEGMKRTTSFSWKSTAEKYLELFHKTVAR